MLYFFLSYARGDDDVFVEQFYRDLCAEVRILAGLSRDTEVGFLDAQSIQLGESWSRRLVDALSECRSFVALTSPRYFVSTACGREWSIFAERLRGFETGAAPTPLIPVAWVRTPRVPEQVELLQFHTAEFGDPYRRLGLRQLSRLQRHRDEYLEFVLALAMQIVRNAHLDPVPAAPRDVVFDHVPSAFEARTPAKQATAQYVHVVVAAATRAELRGLREVLDYHGDDALDWAPYRPELAGALGEHARRVAAERGFDGGLCRIDQLGEVLDEASRRNQIVIVLVDAWTARLPRHRDALAAELEGRPQRIPAVLVPASETDPETLRHWPELSAAVGRLFANDQAQRDDPMFRAAVHTPASFDYELQVVLEWRETGVL